MKARLFRFGFFLFLLEAVTLSAQEASTNRVGRAARTNDAIARIRDEGLNRSQLSNTLSYLCDVIGPRLTGSPNLRHANEWTRDTMLGWGLTNGALEAWGPFGRGWSLQRFSAQVVEPYAIPLIAAPKAWSPGFEKPLTARVVLLDAKTKAIFCGSRTPRPVRARAVRRPSHPCCRIPPRRRGWDYDRMFFRR
jgi:hypothetical protein